MWPSEQSTLVGGEIVLRPWHSDDADAVYVACQDGAIQRFTTIPVPYSREDAVGFVADVAAGAFADKSGIHLCISTPAGGVLGAIGLDVSDAPGTAELGYWLAPAARGRGVASQSISLFKKWAFAELGVTRLELHIEPANEGSAATAERVGARFEGLLPGQRLIRGELRDLAVYAIMPEVS